MNEVASHSTDQPRSGHNEFWEWTKALVIAIILALLIRGFLFAPFLVDGQSMTPNLANHERLIVNKFLYLVRQPHRGEIIVFHATPEKDYIKRVVGLPGETVEIRDDTLYINGKKHLERFLGDVKQAYHEKNMQYTADFGPVEVPQGQLFVLGDNRPNSEDSRVIGPIPLDTVVGRAEVVFWPVTHIRWLHKAGDDTR